MQNVLSIACSPPKIRDSRVLTVIRGRAGGDTAARQAEADGRHRARRQQGWSCFRTENTFYIPKIQRPLKIDCKSARYPLFIEGTTVIATHFCRRP